ncbi:hypothetical protein F4824DRAFT_185331 [Ustulina deusta]|nr:hypothetical protein F4824DRAFT_185331 [Ustulina deusta]
MDRHAQRRAISAHDMGEDSISPLCCTLLLYSTPRDRKVEPNLCSRNTGPRRLAVYASVVIEISQKQSNLDLRRRDWCHPLGWEINSLVQPARPGSPSHHLASGRLRRPTSIARARFVPLSTSLFCLTGYFLAITWGCISEPWVGCGRCGLGKYGAARLDFVGMAHPCHGRDWVEISRISSRTTWTLLKLESPARLFFPCTVPPGCG